MQMRKLDPGELGLFAVFINIYTWIFVIADAFALQNMIQFGVNPANRKHINFISLLILLSITISSSIIIIVIREPLAELFKDPRFFEAAGYLPLLILLTLPRVFCLKLIFRDRQFRDLFFVDLFFFGSMALMTIFLLVTRSELTFRHLIVIYLIGTAMSSAYALIINRKKIEFARSGDLTLKTILKFSFSIAASGTLHNIPRQLDVLMIQTFFSSTVSGIYFSAKTLFRVFDEAVNAAYGMVYPASVKLFEQQDKKGFHDLMTKSVSFLILSFTISILILQFGLGSFVIKLFLPAKYYEAIGMFNILLIAGYTLPFFALASIISATGKPNKVMIIVAIGVVISFSVLAIVGFVGNEKLVPLGMITYSVTTGLLCYLYAYKHFDFKPSQIFRSFGDTAYYAKKLFIKFTK
jgi:O-antigen/teichoic acid export membrane protein